MAEHIVARALRARADALRKGAVTGTVNLGPIVAMEIAQQFELLADTLAVLEDKPLAQAVQPQYEHHGPDEHSPIEHAWAVPGCTHDDDCRVALHPRGLHTTDGKKKLPGLRIVAPVGVSGLGGGGGNVTVSGAGGAGGAGGSSWTPVLTVSAHRIEGAAKAAYTKMAAGQAFAIARPALPWDHLDERDRQSWRDAIRDAIQAALEAERTP